MSTLKFSEQDPGILCCNCKSGILRADTAAICHPSFVDDVVVGIDCPKCGKLMWTCQICYKSWTNKQTNSRHVNSDKHLRRLAEHQVGSEGQDWAFSDDHGDNVLDEISPPEPPTEGDGGNNIQTNSKCDWLTSISQPLGDPALTLEAIMQSGSFPPSSKSPEFYFFESQNPGQGAKYLTAKPFDVSPADVTNEEAEFHLRMTKFLTRLTKTEQEELAYFMLHVYNARDKTLNIFQTTRPPTSTEDFNDFYLGGQEISHQASAHPCCNEN